MNRTFARRLTLITCIHAAVLVFLVFGAWIGVCFRRKSDANKSIVFTVDMRALGPVNKPGPPDLGDEDPVSAIPDPPVRMLAPVAKPNVKKADAKKTDQKSDKTTDKKSDKTTDKKLTGKNSVKLSGRKLGRPTSGPPGTTMKRLSDEEIRRLLAMGATPGSETVIPAQGDMYRLMVRNALYDPWLPPDKGDVGTATATVRIWFGAGGRIVKWSMEKASGVAALDASVVNVMNAVQSIPGLGSDFISQYQWRGFSIDFQVE